MIMFLLILWTCTLRICKLKLLALVDEGLTDLGVDMRLRIFTVL